MSTRADVRRLLGIGDPAARQVAYAHESPASTSEGIARSRVVLVDEDGNVIPCIFLRPTGAGPFPAAIAVHQHHNQFHLGKSEPAGMAGDPDMAYGLALAHRGFATVVPDLVGFEERRGPFDDDAHGERFLAWNLAAQGTTLQGRHTEDVSLAVTWLTSRSDVAGPACAVMGHSLGAQVGFFTMACDERLTAGALNCGVGTVRSFTEHHIMHNPGWYPPGILPFGDAEAVAQAIQGQRVLLTAGTDDPIFPTEGVDAVVEALAGRCHFEAFDGGHALPADVRRRAVDWLWEHSAPRAQGSTDEVGT